MAEAAKIAGAGKIAPPVRPEFERRELAASSFGAVERPLSAWERITNVTAVRRTFIVVLLAVAWELYARWLDNSLIFPTFSETVTALIAAFTTGPLLSRTLTTLQVLLMGYAAGLLLAAVFTTLAVSTRIGTDLLSTLTAMFNPLPAIALLPLALLWFGLGIKSLIFVIIHSVLWAVALNTHSGILSVSDTLRMAGRNVGLTGVRYVVELLIPAAFPSILAGLKIGWAFAWRTLIAAELVFGVSSRQGGLGWFIFENRNLLDTANVFAGLLTVIIIGLLVENVVFRAIEARTVRRWGMQR
jgi:NitT/TauT family transport system permease protein